MTHLPPDLIDQHREALAAGVRVVEMVDAVMHQIEYLRAVHLAALSHLASAIARDEGHRDHGEHVHRAIEAEVAVATRTGQTAVANQMGHAAGLLAQYPAVSEALAQGALSLRHTEVIADAGQIIADPAARAAYETAVLPLARTMSTAQLRPHARRLAERHAERDLEDRHRDARRSREVRVTGLNDGMAQLTAVLGAVEAYAIKDRLSRLAHRRNRRATAEPGVDCEATENAVSGAPTLRQSQADVFVELLLTGDLASGITDIPVGDATDRIAARVQVTVPVFALAGIGGPDAEPYLAGRSPLPRCTDESRQVSPRS